MNIASPISQNQANQTKLKLRHTCSSLFSRDKTILYNYKQMIKLRTVGIHIVTCSYLGSVYLSTDWIIPLKVFTTCSGSAAFSDGVILMSFCPDFFFFYVFCGDVFCLFGLFLFLQFCSFVLRQILSVLP